MMGDKEMDAVVAAQESIKEIIPRWDEDVLYGVAEAAVRGFIHYYRDAIRLDRWAKKQGVGRGDLSRVVHDILDMPVERANVEREVTAAYKNAVDLLNNLQATARTLGVELHGEDDDDDEWDL